MKIKILEERTIKRKYYKVLDEIENLEIKLDYITLKHISFIVKNKKSGKEYNVIYKSEVKGFNCWLCDCEWYSINALRLKKYCKHIIACMLYVKNSNLGKILKIRDFI